MPTPTPQPDDVYTPAQAALRLNLKERTVRDLMRSGAIKARRMGGTPANPRKLRVTEAAVRAYLDALPDYEPATASRKGG